MTSARVLLIDPFSGAGGDMLVAGIIDAGAPVESVRSALASIPAMGGVGVGVERVRRGAFDAARLTLDLPADGAHRGLSDVLAVVDSAATVSAAVRKRCRDAFERLAAAEAKVHGIDVERVHFHEVGALDAIADIVGFFAAAEALEVAGMYYTCLLLGTGTVNSEHGEIPVPVPATLELLRGHGVVFSGLRGEMITPTAAAIISSAFQPLSADATVVPSSVGYSAGNREIGGLPSVLRVVVGTRAPGRSRVSVVRTTIDDMNPEVYGYLMERLFAAGALEVYTNAVATKKNRPATEVTVIAEFRAEDSLACLLLEESTTLGVRIARESRVELERREESVETPLGRARVKIAKTPGGRERMSPEYDSCRRLALESGRPIVEVFEVVRRAWPVAETGGRGVVEDDR